MPIRHAKLLVTRQWCLGGFGQHWADAVQSQRDEQWFQQDGAAPHTSNNTLLWLRQRFEDRLISRRCDIEWVPDLSIFLPLGLSEEPSGYENNSQTIGDLKTAIAARIRAIPRGMCLCH